MDQFLEVIPKGDKNIILHNGAILIETPLDKGSIECMIEDINDAVHIINGNIENVSLKNVSTENEEILFLQAFVGDIELANIYFRLSDYFYQEHTRDEISLIHYGAFYGRGFLLAYKNSTQHIAIDNNVRDNYLKNINRLLAIVNPANRDDVNIEVIVKYTNVFIRTTDAKTGDLGNAVHVNFTDKQAWIVKDNYTKEKKVNWLDELSVVAINEKESYLIFENRVIAYLPLDIELAEQFKNKVAQSFRFGYSHHIIPSSDSFLGITLGGHEAESGENKFSEFFFFDDAGR